MSHPRPGRSFFKIGIDGLEGVPVAIKTALATTVHGSKMVQTNLGKFSLSLFCDSTGQTINKTEEKKRNFGQRIIGLRLKSRNQTWMDGMNGNLKLEAKP